LSGASKLQSRDVAVTCSATAARETPQMIRPDRQHGWARVAHHSQAARARWHRLAPVVVAAYRFDHWSIIDRSPGQRLVHRSITPSSTTPQPPT
jgi:hypothetical protein